MINSQNPESPETNSQATHGSRLRKPHRARTVAAGTLLAAVSFTAGYITHGGVDDVSLKQLQPVPTRLSSAENKPSLREGQALSMEHEGWLATTELSARVLNFVEGSASDHRVSVVTRKQKDISPRAADPSEYTTIVTVKTGSSLKTGTGRYVITMTGKLPPGNKYVDPATVEQFELASYQVQDKPGSAPALLYNFGLYAIGGTANPGWRLDTGVAIPGSQFESASYATEVVEGWGTSAGVRPLDSADLDYRIGQARRVLNQAEYFGPVGYVPGK
jgi:hypothetical protein